MPDGDPVPELLATGSGCHESLPAFRVKHRRQGFRLESAAGLLAPGYTDVETTFWLRWRFGSVRLEETVD